MATSTLDFNKLIAIAQSNTNASTSVKMGTNTKKGTKGPDPSAIAKFLQKKTAEQHQKFEEERRKKERLFALRNQNSKSSKAAKMMACKTKDNDFSKIKLTEREIEDKNRVEKELCRDMLRDPLERMKKRIEKEKEVEESTKGKRKKKSNGSIGNESSSILGVTPREYKYEDVKRQKEEILKKRSGQTASSASSAPTSFNFQELLKRAEQNTKEAPKKKLQDMIDEELKAKKRNRIEKEQEERRLREQYYIERTSKKRLSTIPKKSSSPKPIENSCKKSAVPFSRLERTTLPSIATKMPNTSTVVNSSKSIADEVREMQKQKNLERLRQQQMRPQIPKSGVSPPKQEPKRTEPPKKHGGKLSLINIFNTCSDKKEFSEKLSSLSEEQFRELNKVVSNTLEGKLESRQDKKSKKLESPTKKSKKLKASNETYKRDEFISKQEKRTKEKDYISIEESRLNKQKTGRRLIDLDNCDPAELDRIKQEIVRRNQMAQEQSKVKPFSKSENLKPSIQAKPSCVSPEDVNRNSRFMLPIGATYRRGDYSNYVEDDYLDQYDEEEEEDDDLEGFIDDNEYPQEDEDYSSVIRQIFRYDKRKYRDEDFDDIQESSYAEQMKEEARSARLGRKEDLEDIRREEEELRRKKMAKKRRNQIDSDED